jgi:antitoxin MazE
LAIRIPRSVAADAHLSEASPVDVRVVDGRIVITPAARSAFTLDELLGQITDDNLHAEVPTGPSTGAEEW